MTDTPPTPERKEVQAKDPSKSDTDRPPKPAALCSTGRPHKMVPARKGDGAVCGNCGRLGPATAAQ